MKLFVELLLTAFCILVIMLAGSLLLKGTFLNKLVAFIVSIIIILILIIIQHVINSFEKDDVNEPGWGITMGEDRV